MSFPLLASSVGSAEIKKPDIAVGLAALASDLGVLRKQIFPFREKACVVWHLWFADTDCHH